MPLVTAQMSVSIDGFYAGPKHTDFDTWMEGTEAPGIFRVTRWVTSTMAWRERIELVPTRVVDTPDVTHVRYKVEGPTVLTLDDRGRGDTDTRQTETKE